MIKDVSKQYAAFFNESAEKDQKYAKACEEACREAEELKKQEIDEFDEEEIDPCECGFSEEEIQVDEVVDPLKLWQDAKAQQKKPELVKVDNNYINMMKKLMAGLRSSKKDVYDRICGNGGKLYQYMKTGTMLPPPEDFAENFVSFEEISKAMSKGKDDPESKGEKTDGEDVGDEDMSLTSRAAKEFDDTKGAFGNKDAEENLWDSDLSEEELAQMGYSKDNVNEADYREPISHALDTIGVKASTASLASQDAAAISVVEKLLSKIEKLESKIEILESRAEKNSVDATSSKSVKEADTSFEDLSPEEKDDVEFKVTSQDIESSKRKFKSGLDKLSKEEIEKMFDEMADRITSSLKAQKDAGADPSVRHSQKEVADAVKKINFFRELSYEKELTDAQKKQFADLVYKYWYDWIGNEKQDENGDITLDPVRSVKDMLNQPFKSFFGRPGNHVSLATEFRIYDNGNTYVLQPFQYTRDPYDELKTTKARRQKIAAKDLQAAADAGKGFKPPKGKEGEWIADDPEQPLRKPTSGEKGTWTINDWNHMIGTLSKARREEIEKELRAEIEKENPSDEFTRAKELAFLKMIFNRAGNASAANADYFNKMEKAKRKKQRQLNAMKKDMENQLEEISKKIESLEKKQKELKKRLEDDPDDDEADSELVDLGYDLADAWDEYNDKEEEIRDMAENADDYLDNYSPDPDDGEDEDEDVEEPKNSSNGKVKAKDLRKLSGIATVDLAPTMKDTSGKPYEVHAYRNFEKHTIDSILQTLADVTGTYDEKKLLQELSDMSDNKFREFLSKLKARSTKKPKATTNRVSSSNKPKKDVKKRPAGLM